MARRWTGITSPMKIYKTQEEIDADIVDGMLEINDDVTFHCNVTIQASIAAWNITARDINADDITARDINAWDISFYAICFAYNSFKCQSITGRRENSKYGCLDSDVVIGKTV